VEEVQEEEGEMLEEIDESEPEREARFITSIFTRKDDSGLEDELEYLWDAHALSSPEEPEEDRWWSLEPPQPSSEEDEEEVQYLIQVLGLEPREGEAGQEVNFAPERAVASPEGGTTTSEASQRKRLPHSRSTKRRRLRRGVARTKDQE
jgi:hypothetical protein